jgi:hypothetical protein
VTARPLAFPPTDGGLGRIFGVVDDRPGDSSPALRSYEAILALVVGVEYWLRAFPKWGLLAPHYYALLALATVACPLALTRRLRRPAFASLALSHGVLVWTEFPATGNHAYLELMLCALAAFLDPSAPGEARLYTRAVRWLTLVILAYSGLHKLAHGYYLHGEYLAFSLGSTSFRPVLRPLLAREEFARLVAFTGALGDGPYRVQSWPLLVVSNLTWLTELALVPLLCVRRTRLVGVGLALALVVAIEAGAREVFFGLVFADAILLFASGTAQRAALPVVVAILSALTLSRLGIVPAVTFY